VLRKGAGYRHSDCTAMAFSRDAPEGFDHTFTPCARRCPPRLMNLPNKLTLIRFGLTAAFAGVLETDWSFRCSSGLALFVVASLTDYADGAIARKYGLVTDFGALMDPLVDKILIATALVSLSAIPYHGRPALPAWVGIVVIGREFLITGLRQIAASKGMVLAADRWGKHKTIWQIIAILYFFLLLTLEELSAPFGGWVLPQWGGFWELLGKTISAVALGLTIGSGVGYLWRNRALIADR
jgi:CDP-diacylglycerol--glycerol-3-phosphate 3-phosphatidyltransferase